MGQKIWGVLADYAGLWVAMDKDGRVLDHAEDLKELTRRAREAGASPTFVWAADAAAAEPVRS